MSTKVGYVTHILGDVKAVATDGSERTLTINDPVYESELLKTGPGALLSVALETGGQLDMGRDSVLTLDAETLGTETYDEAVAEVEAMQQRMETEPATAAIR